MRRNKKKEIEELKAQVSVLWGVVEAGATYLEHLKAAMGEERPMEDDRPFCQWVVLTEEIAADPTLKEVGANLRAELNRQIDLGIKEARLLALTLVSHMTEEQGDALGEATQRTLVRWYEETTDPKHRMAIAGLIGGPDA